MKTFLAVVSVTLTLVATPAFAQYGAVPGRSTQQGNTARIVPARPVANSFNRVSPLQDDKAAVAPAPAPSVGDQYFSNDACCNQSRFGRLGGLLPPIEYVTIFGGWVGVDAFADPHPNSAPVVNQTQASFNDGWGLGGAIGRQLTCNLRMESEFVYRNNTGNQFTVNNYNNGNLVGTQSWNVTGQLNSYTTMTNIYRDFKGRGCWTPYIGGGIGICYLDGDFQVPQINGTYQVDDNCFAYQGIAGVRCQINCRTSLFCEYRYFTTDGVEYSGGINGPLANTVSGEFDNTSHNVFVGLKINLR